MTRKIIFNGLAISFQNTVHYRMFQFQATLFTYFVIKGYFNAKTSIEWHQIEAAIQRCS